MLQTFSFNIFLQYLPLNGVYQILSIVTILACVAKNDSCDRTDKMKSVIHLFIGLTYLFSGLCQNYCKYCFFDSLQLGVPVGHILLTWHTVGTPCVKELVVL